MKQSSGYLLKIIAGVPYLLPYGQNIADHRRGVQLNETGVFLWNCLAQEQTKKELEQKLSEHFSLSPEELPEIRQDLELFLNRLISLNMLDNTGAETPELSCRYLRIGGLYLKLSGMNECFPKEFDPFEVREYPHIDLTIDVHNSALENLKQGKLLLKNRELFILEEEKDYVLLFPMAVQISGVRLKMDGSYACFYCRPPYSKQTVTDLFHAIRLVYLYCAGKRGIFALHSASILYRGKAWLFSGPSGTGKSTHTNLWRELFHTPVINGDLNLITLDGETAMVYGLPWCGTSGISDAKTYPLGGIILLRQAPFSRVDAPEEHEKALLIMQRLISPSWTKGMLERNLEFTEKLVQKIYVGKLNCTKDNESAEMMKQKIDENEA